MGATIEIGTFTNSAGVAWRVVMERARQQIDGDRWTIAFYDGAQRVGSYYSSTLLGESASSRGTPENRGLALDLDQPRWSIDGSTMARVRAAIRAARQTADTFVAPTPDPRYITRRECFRCGRVVDQPKGSEHLGCGGRVVDHARVITHEGKIL